MVPNFVNLLHNIQVHGIVVFMCVKASNVCYKTPQISRNDIIYNQEEQKVNVTIEIDEMLI